MVDRHVEVSAVFQIAEIIIFIGYYTVILVIGFVHVTDLSNSLTLLLFD